MSPPRWEGAWTACREFLRSKHPLRRALPLLPAPLGRLAWVGLPSAAEEVKRVIAEDLRGQQ